MRRAPLLIYYMLTSVHPKYSSEKVMMCEIFCPLVDKSQVHEGIACFQIDDPNLDLDLDLD